ncbi:hypothetical protein Tco_1089393, partial [Tanacetum coccineum]
DIRKVKTYSIAIGHVQDVYFLSSYCHFYRTSKSCGAKKFFGTERAVGLLSWLEEMEYVLYISKCPAESQVEFASSQPWEDLKKLLREEYCPDNAIKKFKEEL